MSDHEQIVMLEHRVRELQTAVAAIVRHLGIEHDVTAAERARLDEVKAKGDRPSTHLSELYDTPPQS
ncbi:MAG TPA: hypothetical protein VKG38_13705 [Solirubrobacteraceae bacterium]|nr:hypothetical protein [Solirubrobacteraceae bacterium]